MHNDGTTLGGAWDTVRWNRCTCERACLPVLVGDAQHLCRGAVALAKGQANMEIVSGGLHAGYSLENAFLSARATADREYPLMSRELTLLANGLSCRKRLEELLLEFGRRSGVPEIMEFAGLVETAKVYGGNIPQLIRQMTDNFAQTEQLEAEIQTVIAAKRLEGRIMLVVPFAILLYFRILNPSYMQVLYHTIAGRCCMTICMLIIAACAGWIDKIVRIEV